MTEWCPIHGPDPRGPQPLDVTLMADYGCYLWSHSRELSRLRDDDGNLDPRQLGISDELIAAMQAWHQDWEAIAWSNVGFASDDAARAWTRRGWELAHRLQEELPDVEVSYQHDTRGPLSVRNHCPVAGGARHRPAIVQLLPDNRGVFLWNTSSGRTESDPYALQPEDLGLSDALTEDLVDWYGIWERGLDRMSQQFPCSGGSGPAWWAHEGRRLAQRLQEELGPDVEVLYDGLP